MLADQRGWSLATNAMITEYVMSKSGSLSLKLARPEENRGQQQKEDENANGAPDTLRHSAPAFASVMGSSSTFANSRRNVAKSAVLTSLDKEASIRRVQNSIESVEYFNCDGTNLAKLHIKLQSHSNIYGGLGYSKLYVPPEDHDRFLDAMTDDIFKDAANGYEPSDDCGQYAFSEHPSNPNRFRFFMDFDMKRCRFKPNKDHWQLNDDPILKHLFLTVQQWVREFCPEISDKEWATMGEMFVAQHRPYEIPNTESTCMSNRTSQNILRHFGIDPSRLVQKKDNDCVHSVDEDAESSSTPCPRPSSCSSLRSSGSQMFRTQDILTMADRVSCEHSNDSNFSGGGGTYSSNVSTPLYGRDEDSQPWPLSWSPKPVQCLGTSFGDLFENSCPSSFPSRPTTKHSTSHNDNATEVFGLVDRKRLLCHLASVYFDIQQKGADNDAGRVKSAAAGGVASSSSTCSSSSPSAVGWSTNQWKIGSHIFFPNLYVDAAQAVKIAKLIKARCIVTYGCSEELGLNTPIQFLPPSFCSGQFCQTSDVSLSDVVDHWDHIIDLGVYGTVPEDYRMQEERDESEQVVTAHVQHEGVLSRYEPLSSVRRISNAKRQNYPELGDDLSLPRIRMIYNHKQDLDCPNCTGLMQSVMTQGVHRNPCQNISSSQSSQPHRYISCPVCYGGRKISSGSHVIYEVTMAVDGNGLEKKYIYGRTIGPKPTDYEPIEFSPKIFRLFESLAENSPKHWRQMRNDDARYGWFPRTLPFNSHRIYYDGRMRPLALNLKEKCQFSDAILQKAYIRYMLEKTTLLKTSEKEPTWFRISEHIDEECRWLHQLDSLARQRQRLSQAKKARGSGQCAELAKYLEWQKSQPYGNLVHSSNSQPSSSPSGSNSSMRSRTPSFGFGPPLRPDPLPRTVRPLPNPDTKEKPILKRKKTWTIFNDPIGFAQIQKKIRSLDARWAAIILCNILLNKTPRLSAHKVQHQLIRRSTNDMNFAKKTTATTSEETLFREYLAVVAGPGSHYCCNVKRPHKQRVIYFIINIEGITQCCSSSSTRLEQNRHNFVQCFLREDILLERWKPEDMGLVAMLLGPAAATFLTKSNVMATASCAASQAAASRASEAYEKFQDDTTARNALFKQSIVDHVKVTLDP
jgi:hypothetical protein